MSSLDSNELPSSHQIKAARWVARLLADAMMMSTPEARGAYGRAATDGLFDSNDLCAGEAVLVAAGFLSVADDAIIADSALADAISLGNEGLDVVILERLILRRRPLWLSAALTPAGIDDGMLPDAVRQGLEWAIPDVRRREELLLRLGRRFDDAERRRTGEIAEEGVITACRAELTSLGRADLAAKVKRVSVLSDQLGYDVVAPRLDGRDRRIEAKGTRASGDVIIVNITRNEAKTGLRDPEWSLVVCRVSPDDQSVPVGWLDGPRLLPHLPSDSDAGGEWEAAQIYLVSHSDLSPGLPPC